jgi:hypothetical protein
VFIEFEKPFQILSKYNGFVGNLQKRNKKNIASEKEGCRYTTYNKKISRVFILRTRLIFVY